MNPKANKLSRLLQTIQDEANHCLNTDGSEDRLEIFIADVQVIAEKAKQAGELVHKINREHLRLREMLSFMLSRLDTFGNLDSVRGEGPIQDARDVLRETTDA